MARRTSFRRLLCSLALVLGLGAVAQTGTTSNASPPTLRLVSSATIGGDRDDMFTSVAAADGGAVYVAGTTDSTVLRGHRNHGDTDAFVAKLTEEGHVRWLRMLGEGYAEEGLAVAAMPDGGVAVAGGQAIRYSEPPMTSTSGEIWRLSSDGDAVWHRRLRSVNRVVGVVASPDGGLYFAGEGYGGNHSDIVAGKLHEDGTVHWRNHIRTTSNASPAGVVLHGERLVIVGRAGGGDFLGTKIPADRSVRVMLTFDSDGHRRSAIVSASHPATAGGAIAASPTGGFAVAGTTWQPHVVGQQGVVVRHSQTGRIIWSQSLEGAESVVPGAVAHFPDGSIVAAGSIAGRQSHGAIWHLSSSGELLPGPDAAGNKVRQYRGVLVIEDVAWAVGSADGPAGEGSDAVITRYRQVPPGPSHLP